MKYALYKGIELLSCFSAKSEKKLKEQLCEFLKIPKVSLRKVIRINVSGVHWVRKFGATGLDTKYILGVHLEKKYVVDSET